MNNNVTTENITLSNLETNMISMSELTLQKSYITITNFNPITINSNCGKIIINNISITQNSNVTLVVYNNMTTLTSIILINALEYSDGFPYITVINVDNGSFTISIDNLDSVYIITQLSIGFFIL